LCGAGGRRMPPAPSDGLPEASIPPGPPGSPCRGSVSHGAAVVRREPHCPSAWAAAGPGGRLCSSPAPPGETQLEHTALGPWPCVSLSQMCRGRFENGGVDSEQSQRVFARRNSWGSQRNERHRSRQCGSWTAQPNSSQGWNFSGGGERWKQNTSEEGGWQPDAFLPLSHPPQQPPSHDTLAQQGCGRWGFFGDSAPSLCPLAASSQAPVLGKQDPSLQSLQCCWQTGLLHFQFHQVTWVTSLGLRSLLVPLVVVWRGTSQLCPAPAPPCRRATHGDGVARNNLYSYAGDGEGAYTGPWGDSSARFQLAQGSQGATAQQKGPSSEPL